MLQIPDCIHAACGDSSLRPGWCDSEATVPPAVKIAAGSENRSAERRQEAFAGRSSRFWNNGDKRKTVGRGGRKGKIQEEDFYGLQDF